MDAEAKGMQDAEDRIKKATDNLKRKAAAVEHKAKALMTQKRAMQSVLDASPVTARRMRRGGVADPVVPDPDGVADGGAADDTDAASPPAALPAVADAHPSPHPQPRPRRAAAGVAAAAPRQDAYYEGQALHWEPLCKFSFV